MKNPSILLLMCLFLRAGYAIADGHDPKPREDETWPLPTFFMQQSHAISIDWIAVQNNDATLTVAFKSTCKTLSRTEQKAFRNKFYFGQSAKQTAPTCLLSKFEFLIEGVMHEIPKALMSQFADAPLASSVKWKSLAKSRLVAFSGGRGEGRYEALLTFRAGKLIAQHVIAYDPALGKMRAFTQEFERKQLE